MCGEVRNVGNHSQHAPCPRPGAPQANGPVCLAHGGAWIPAQSTQSPLSEDALCVERSRRGLLADPGPLPSVWQREAFDASGFFLFSFFFSCFLGLHPWAYGVFQAKGHIGAASRWPTPQSQQLRIQASSATCTPAHSNTRSLTH